MIATAQQASGVRILLATSVLIVTGAAASFAQPSFGGWGRSDHPYDGRLTFARLRWTTGSYGAPVAGMGINFWLHEFPRAEQNLMAVVDDFTLIDTRTDGSLVLSLDDPNLFKHPIVTMWEPGFWTMTDAQAASLRAYLLKGGFVIFNDFEGRQWENFEAQMKRVLPGALWLPLEDSHPIFHAFFSIEGLDTPNPMHHHLFGLRPEYFGLFEKNDPEGRLMAIANYNTNLGEYWQARGLGYFPFDSLGRGFQLGVNYLIYGLTH